MDVVNAEKPDPQIETGPFGSSREGFAEMLGWLEGTEAAALTHADLEQQVTRRGRELCRRMFQDHLDLRALRERRRRGRASLPRSRSSPATGHGGGHRDRRAGRLPS